MLLALSLATKRMGMMVMTGKEVVDWENLQGTVWLTDVALQVMLLYGEGVRLSCRLRTRTGPLAASVGVCAATALGVP